MTDASSTDYDSVSGSPSWLSSPLSSPATEDYSNEKALRGLGLEDAHSAPLRQMTTSRNVATTCTTQMTHPIILSPILGRPQRPPPVLHDDAVDEILAMVFPPPRFMDPALSLGPDSPWSRALRTRKALMLVCRSWWRKALPLLYTDIVIRRPSQIHALEETVSSNPEVFGNTIKSVTVLCYVPRPLRHTVLACLTTIVTSAKYLTSVCWGPLFIAAVDDLPPNSTGPLYKRLSELPTLAAFEYNQSLRREIAWPAPLLASFRHLTHLTVFMPTVRAGLLPVPLRHVALQVLRFVYMYECVGDADLLVFTSWTLPALKQVHFRPYIDLARLPRNYYEFLLAHRHISTLDLGGSPTVNTGPHDGQNQIHVRLYEETQRALEKFTALKHLVLPAQVYNVHIFDTPMASLQLPHVDLWASITDARLRSVFIRREHPGPDDADDESGKGGQLGRFWRSVRVFDNGLSCVLDVPHLLRPEGRPAPGEIQTHDIFGLGIVETHSCVVRQDRLWGSPEGDSDAPTAADSGSRANIYAYLAAHEDSDASDIHAALEAGNYANTPWSDEDEVDDSSYTPSDTSDEESDSDTDAYVPFQEMRDLWDAWYNDFGPLPEQLDANTVPDDGEDDEEEEDYSSSDPQDDSSGSEYDPEMDVDDEEEL